MSVVALTLLAGCGTTVPSPTTGRPTSLAAKAVPQQDWDVDLLVNGQPADWFSARQHERVTVKVLLTGQAPGAVTYAWKVLGGLVDRREGPEVRWWLDWPATSQLEVTATAADGTRRTHRTVAMVQAIPTPPPPPYIPFPPLPVKP
ncbi:MAG: hypothetical protein VKO21_07115 [Candidatus Sericytochromatia bacterium]|nr:hypothetical protein [Candidatus Sericytochromatia bacterium]